MLRRNVTKPFTIAGFVVGEIYMFFTVLAPSVSEHSTGNSTLFWRALTSALFFGPFGAAVGLGVGLLVSAVLRGKSK